MASLPLPSRTTIVAASVDDDHRQRRLPLLPLLLTAVTVNNDRQFPSSMTTIGAVGSIPPLPPSMITVVDKDRLAKEHWVGAITAWQGHR
jgi:hypothetical protein